jgi:hypothetical protein
MAKMRTAALRKLHADLGQILEDYDCSRAEEAGGKDKVLDLSGPDTDVKTPESEGAMDSRRGKSMSEAFPGFNRIPNFK